MNREDMSQTDAAQAHATAASSYFFLSYAHSPPLAGSLHTDPDQWVRTFFEDLTEAVQRHSKEPVNFPGYFDQDLPLYRGWKASLTRALSTAETFVPLLSPGYYTRSWPGREWACFEARLRSARLDKTQRDLHFAPVLWIPVPGSRHLPGLSEALDLGGSDPAYAENGLRALLRLAPYRAYYQAIVERLADKIVGVAKAAPLPPSVTPTFDDVSSPFESTPSAATFVVRVAAPQLSKLPTGRDWVGYGHRGLDWRAYPDEQELPLAEYAAQVAEQLDFAVQVVDIDDDGVSPDGQPGVLLVDPWFAADGEGVRVLRSFVRGMPPWILPAVVADPVTDRRVNALIEQVQEILGQSAGTAEPALRAATNIRSLKDFVTVMPILVTEAGRRYLRRPDSVGSTSGSRFWPRLTMGSGPPSKNDEENHE